MFGDNPFDPFNTRRQMNEMDRMMNSMLSNPFGMMDNFLNDFGHPRMGMLEGTNRNRRNGNPEVQLASPFGFGGNMFGNMMQQMQMFDSSSMMNDPHSHVFSQSTMISYDGNGAPKIVQNSVRKSGDVKETRRTVRDGEREEVSVGHSIGDREHFIEKKRDSDGRIRKNQRFVNLDEGEAESFNHEFKTRAGRNLNGMFGGSSSGSRHRAIENNRSSRRTEEMEHSGPSRRSTKETQPIIEIPDDDEDELPRNNPRITYSNSRNGPRISEVSEDDIGSSSKRRKGMFGRYFANDD